jgi:hypothetical protein
MSASLVERDPINEFVVIDSWFQGVHVETEKRFVQANLIKMTPLDFGDPCLDCELLDIACCEEPCKKIHDFMKMNPNLGDKYRL